MNFNNQAIYGFTAQGEPITDPRDTMLYRSYQLIEPRLKSPVRRVQPKVSGIKLGQPPLTEEQVRHQRLIDQFDYATFQTEEADQMIAPGSFNPNGKLPPAGLPITRASMKKPDINYRPPVYNQGFEQMAFNAHYTGNFQTRAPTDNLAIYPKD